MKEGALICDAEERQISTVCNINSRLMKQGALISVLLNND